MRKILTLTGLVLGLLLMLAVPASAHSSLLSGQTACVNGNHVVTWTIGNDYHLTMAIDTATASMNGQTYPVVGYTSPVGVSPATTTATTTVPGNLTGTVTLTVHSIWTDEYSQTNTTTVPLTVPCTEATTTTTVPDTTTTVPVVTTTTLPNTTTTLPTTTTSIDVLPTTTIPSTSTTKVPPSTTVPPPIVTTTSEVTTTTNICTVPPITSITPGPCTPLPHTGSNSGPLALGGILALGAGAALAGTAKRRNWI